MKCIDEGKIQAYIDGELSAQQMSAIEIHIGQCELCEKKLQFQTKLAQQMKEQLNLLSHNEELIEWSKPIEPKKLKTPKYKEVIIYVYAIASIALLALLFSKNASQKPVDNIEYYYSMEYEVDANRPVTEQSFVINIVDPNGKESELQVE